MKRGSSHRLDYAGTAVSGSSLRDFRIWGAGALLCLPLLTAAASAFYELDQSPMVFGIMMIGGPSSVMAVIAGIMLLPAGLRWRVVRWYAVPAIMSLVSIAWFGLKAEID